jgi:hypothetical protein
MVRTQPTDWESVLFFFLVRVGDRRPHAHVPSTSLFWRLPSPSPPSSHSRWWLDLMFGFRATGRQGLGRERKNSVACFGWGDGLGWRISQIIVKREQEAAAAEEGRRDVWDIIRSWIFFVRYPRVVLYKLVSRCCFLLWLCVCVCVCFFVCFWVFFLVHLEVCSLHQRV